MDNSAIADNFDLLAKLMDINGENSFKTKTFAVAAFNIEKLPMQLKDTPREKLFSIKGIGDNVGRKVIEMLDTGKLEVLSEYISKTLPSSLWARPASWLVSSWRRRTPPLKPSVIILKKNCWLLFPMHVLTVAVQIACLTPLPLPLNL